MNTIEISFKGVSYTINLATRHTKNDTLSSVGFLKSRKNILDIISIVDQMTEILTIMIEILRYVPSILSLI